MSTRVATTKRRQACETVAPDDRVVRQGALADRGVVAISATWLGWLIKVRRVHPDGDQRRRGGGPVTGQSAAATLRAFGFDAGSDGLGNVQARVWHRHTDGAAGWRWVRVPTDPAGLLAWLAEFRAA